MRAHTKIISGFSTTDDHSTGELSLFPDIMARTADLCPQIEVMLGDALYSNRKMPTKIRKKLPLLKKTEETLKINMHNLRQYNYLKHTNPDMIKDYRGHTQNNFD